MLRTISHLLLVAVTLGATAAHAQIIRRPPTPPPTQPGAPPERGRIFGPRPLPNQPDPTQPAAPSPTQPVRPRVDYTGALAKSLAAWQAKLPTKAADFATINSRDIIMAGLEVEQYAADVALYDPDAPPATLLQLATILLDLKEKIDSRMFGLLALRGEVGALVTADKGRDTARNYLHLTSGLIDLSGRIRYLLYDMLEDIAGDLADRAVPREQFIGLLCDRKSNVGASVMSVVLTDPPPTAPPGVKPVSNLAKSRLLKLIADCGREDLIPQVLMLLKTPGVPPDLCLQAAETIKAVGLPQEPRPDQDPTLPKPAVRPSELLTLVNQIKLSPADSAAKQRQDTLVTWLTEFVKSGATGDSFRVNGFDVRPGDWLLMRNPSPYNLFTDISPGLFTHVGVVATETGTDGLRRFVIVDLPERGTSMPATNVEIFLQRTLHYMFARHADATVAKKMGDAASAVIGNESLFDLNFRTDRLTALQGQNLKGQKIHTYCAGFLVLCADQTGLPRNEFFPVPEFPARGFFVENLKQLGMSIGDQFVSPTGALFSAKMRVIGTREPMNDPRRDIEEMIFNHFARRMEQVKLNASPDTFQSIRLKLAEASKTNPLLAKALADAANVNSQMDLVAAAKAAVVIETLDEIAYGASGAYLAAYDWVTSGDLTPEQSARLTKEQLAERQLYRQRHAKEVAAFDKEEMTFRGVRFALMKYYIQEGTAKLDQRFFQIPPPSTTPGK